MTSLVIAAPPQFDFLQTVHSHGWAQLPPYSWDQASETLHYVLRSASDGVQRLQIQAIDDALQVHLPDCPSPRPALRDEVESAVRRALNLDWDIAAFYAAMRAHDGYAWLEKERQGRILVCPSLWEDLVKTLLTTNCSWSQTVNMTRQLCQLGAAHPSLPGCHAFPCPRRIADMTRDELAKRLRAGYRVAYLHELASKVSAGEIDLEAWQRLESGDLFKAVKSLKGFGDYAAGTVARLLGHFEHIAIDTACHAMFAARHKAGSKADAKAIAAHYAQYGKWRGLVMWMDIMRFNRA